MRCILLNSLGKSFNMHSYQSLIMALLLSVCFDEADNNRNLHLFAFFSARIHRGISKFNFEVLTHVDLSVAFVSCIK